MLTPLGPLLEKTARSMAGESFRLAQIRELWVEAVGEAFASQLEPSGLKGDVLYVATNDAGEGNDHFIFVGGEGGPGDRWRHSRVPSRRRP